MLVATGLLPTVEVLVGPMLVTLDRLHDLGRLAEDLEMGDDPGSEAEAKFIALLEETVGLIEGTIAAHLIGEARERYELASVVRRLLLDISGADHVIMRRHAERGYDIAVSFPERITATPA